MYELDRNKDDKKYHMIGKLARKVSNQLLALLPEGDRDKVGWDIERYFIVPPPLDETIFDLKPTNVFASSIEKKPNGVIELPDVINALDEYTKMGGGNIDTGKAVWALPSRDAQKECEYYLTESNIRIIMVCDQGVIVGCWLDDNG